MERESLTEEPPGSDPAGGKSSPEEESENLPPVDTEERNRPNNSKPTSTAAHLMPLSAHHVCSCASYDAVAWIAVQEGSTAVFRDRALATWGDKRRGDGDWSVRVTRCFGDI